MMPTGSESRSIGELLRDLANDSASLVRQEFALARTEVEDKLHQTVTGSFELVIGALLAFAALIVLLDALVYGLTEAGLERWLAALIVGGVVAAMGFLLVRKGQSDLSASRLMPERATANVRKDLEMVREQVS
jgi:Putative Actinobacterial Holin-X, holin superfamily III